MNKGQAHYEIYDKRTGETIESGYSKQGALNSIAWAWNTGGEVSHMAVRRDPSYVPTVQEIESARRAQAARWVSTERSAGQRGATLNKPSGSAPASPGDTQ